MNLFELNGYDVSRVLLSVAGIDEVADILVIAAPSRDLESDEIKQIDQYMINGGKVMVFMEPSVGEFPNLNDFLNSWGIGVGDKVVFEKKAFITNNHINIIPMYARHEINLYFGDKRSFLVMPSSRNLYKVEYAGFDLDVMAVLVSTPDSYGKEGKEFVLTEKEQSDTEGPFSLVMSSVREVIKDGNPVYAKLFVVGSKNIYADDIMGISSYANVEFLTQAINWLSESHISIRIPSKNIAAESINIVPFQAAVIGVILILLIPGGIFLFGIIIFIRRKNL